MEKKHIQSCFLVNSKTNDDLMDVFKTWTENFGTDKINEKRLKDIFEEKEIEEKKKLFEILIEEVYPFVQHLVSESLKANEKNNKKFLPRFLKSD